MNVFQNSAKTLPKSDKQIIRVDMETQEIGGRKSSLPTEGKSDSLAIKHIANGDSGS